MTRLGPPVNLLREFHARGMGNVMELGSAALGVGGFHCGSSLTRSVS